MYSLALFVHIVGAVLLFVLLTIEGAGLRAGFATANVNRILGPISALAILVPGLYMMAVGPGWKAWVAVGFATWLLIAVLGAVTGISVMSGRINNRAATISWLIRIGMALGVVFDMTVQPDLIVSVGAVMIGVIVGGAASLVQARQVRSA